MSTNMSDFFKMESLSDLHTFLGLEGPKHPMVSVVDFSQIDFREEMFVGKTIVNDFYVVSFKEHTSKTLVYGRENYDFAAATMLFLSPSQVFQVGGDFHSPISGWGLYFHPDLIVGTSLFDKMDNYNFFNYSSHEALHLSDGERQQVENIIQNIKTEYSNNLDRQSKTLIVSNIELLLNYCERFYNRQFITRSHQNQGIVSRFEQLVKDYYKQEKQLELGLISLDFLARELNLSKSYLSDLISKETGKTIKEFVHLHVIDLAKNRLLSTDLTVGEIAYELGFEYPQYFSRLFKSKVGSTPGEFRNLN